MNKKLKKAIDKIFVELQKYGPNEFSQELKKHENGSLSLSIHALWKGDNENVWEEDKEEDIFKRQ